MNFSKMKHWSAMRLPWGASWIGVVTLLSAILIGCLLGAVVLRPIANDSWPAWVQAVGSVIAIFIAVLVPNRIAAKERKAREMQWTFRAKSYAFVLLPLIESLMGQIGTARARWMQTPDEYDDDDVVEFLGIPAGVTDRMLDLHEIGQSGLAIQDVLIATDRLKKGVYYQYAHWRHGGIYYDPSTGDEGEMPEPDDVNKLFDRAQAKAKGAVAALNRVLNS